MHLQFQTSTQANPLTDGVRKDVFAYRRCLYCDHGEMGVQVLDQWQLNSGPSRFPSPFSGKYLFNHGF